MGAKEPFYFKSYDRVIGVAHDEVELLNEMERLSGVDPRAVEYHIIQGHMASWLNYIGRDDLAPLLGANVGLQQAISLLRDSLAGASDELTCPLCGFRGKVRDFRLARAPWRFGNFIGRTLACPSCKGRFRFFYPIRQGLRPFTIPRGKGQENP
ncbi:MAG: hypothetical protein ACP5HK_06735 [Acidilobus sp.]